ncbi:hypothetical protein MNBD_DELTA02-1022 [hydrothermal vent metagenome]|uniref:Histidine kinase n=1 Tax=hydrothermal vent metagenome TaxID=652676 RepID=A0A3B0V8G9_9ZZZZ
MNPSILIFLPAVVSAVILIIFAVAVFLRARRRKAALESLMRAAALIGRGEYDGACIECGTGGGPGELARALGDAAEAIKKRSLNNRYLKRVIDTMDASLIVVAPDGLIKTVNQATISLLGYSEDELLGQPFMVLTGRRVKGEMESSDDIRYMSKDGRSIPIHFSSSELAADGGEAPGMVCVARDISEHSAVQEALKQSEGKLNAILQAIGDFIIMIDKDMHILWANDAVTSVFGFDIIGRDCYAAMFNRKEACLDGDCPVKGTFEDRLSHSAEINVDIFGEARSYECSASVAMRDVDGAPLAAIEVCKDITEYKRAEQALIQNAKLASLGELGAGIAHELNSPLAGILSLSELMLGRMEGTDPNYVFVEKIKDATVRSKNIIMDLMSYARPGAEQWRPLSVNDALRSVLSLFVSELKTFQVKIEEDLAADLPEIMGNKGQLMEVFLNIIKNAKDVFVGKGNIKIKTSLLKDGASGFVEVEISDDGPGIPEDVIGKIFDPFYTTKEKGGGMNIGLGLSISKGIVEAHDGTVKVESMPGAGTRFSLLFPVVAERNYGGKVAEVENAESCG